MSGTSPAFDGVHPPEPALVADCVHCGFCLPSCPTYLLWQEEMDSPRGRIHLMDVGLRGEPMDDAMVRHFDQCLGCLACVTACPSGVQYDKLIEATRSQVERRHRRGPWERLLRWLVFSLFPHPRRLRLLLPVLRLYQRLGLHRLVRRLPLPPSVAAMERLAPPAGPAAEIPAFTSARGDPRARVALLLGCVQQAFFSEVNAATARVLAAEGCDVFAPASQGCCGALSLHMGREDEAIAFAKRLIAALPDDVDAVVVNAAGCGSAMKGYRHLLRDEPGWRDRAEGFAARVRDVSEWLAALPPRAPRHPLPLSVGYHDACHLSHGQGVRAQPRQLLGGVPGVELVPLAEPEVCCGSAGVYNLLEPAPAAALGERKAGHIRAAGVDLVVSGNPGCLLQLSAGTERGGRRQPVRHLVEVLDASIRGIPSSDLLG